MGGGEASGSGLKMPTSGLSDGAPGVLARGPPIGPRSKTSCRGPAASPPARKTVVAPIRAARVSKRFHDSAESRGHVLYGHLPPPASGVFEWRRRRANPLT